MITRSEILDALDLCVQEALPVRMIYRETLPDEFERPSLLIALDKRAVKDGNDGTVEVAQPFRVRIFGLLSTPEQTNADSLQQDADTIEQILWRGYLPVANRRLHVEHIGAKREAEDPIRVYGTLHYFDDRPQSVDNDPAAAEVIKNIKAKEDN